MSLEKFRHVPMPGARGRRSLDAKSVGRNKRWMKVKGASGGGRCLAVLALAALLVCAPCPVTSFSVCLAPCLLGSAAKSTVYLGASGFVMRSSLVSRAGLPWTRRLGRPLRGATGLAASFSGVLPDKGADIGMQQMEDFRKMFSQSLSSNTFVKATLSQNKGDDKTLTNVYMRLVSLKAGVSLQVKLRHKTNDVTKNFPVAEADNVVRDLLTGGFRQAYLFTSDGDWQLKLGKKAWLQRVGKGPTFEKAAVEKHDRVKSLPVKKDALYLQLLGITNGDGQPRPGKSDKLKQIQQFVSVVNRVVEESGLATDIRAVGGARALRVVDMGCGKGYLTFAAHCHLSDALGLPVRTQGVELRQQLVDDTNAWCEELGIAPSGDSPNQGHGDQDEVGLSFVQGYISGKNSQTSARVIVHRTDIGR